MHIDVNNLKEILEVLEPELARNFLRDYDRSMSKDTNTYFRVCQRILGQQSGIKPKFVQRDIVSKYSEMFDALDELNNPLAKQQITHKLYHFLTLYERYYIRDYERYLSDLKEFEYLGIDFLNIGADLSKLFDTSILTKEGYRVNSLRVYSDGLMISPILYRSTTLEGEIVGCVFNLKDASFVLQSYPSTVKEKGMANYLSMRSPNVDMSNLAMLADLDTCEFEFNSDISRRSEEMEDGKTLNLSLYKGISPQNLYKGW